MGFRTCIHIFTNGIKCQSPALRNSVRCYFHHNHRRLKRADVVKSLDTRKDQLAALNKIAHALWAGRIDPEVARSLAYTISQAQLL